MNHIELNVPLQVQYLSEWPDLLAIITQNKKCILNKIRTGCGGTTLFLQSDLPCIIVSPRINVLLSKHYQPDSNTFLFCSADSDPIPKKKEKLKIYVNNHWYNPFGMPAKPPKILVTIDSYKYVAEELNFMGILDQFVVLVDEFQCLMSDAAFKGNVGLTFLHNLTGVRSVCYLSATPIEETYLDQMDDFQDVDVYYKLNWDPSVLVPTNLLPVAYKKGDSSKSICSQIIADYKRDGYFKKKVYNDQIVYSHEVCIFLNDVNAIISIIKANKLDPNDVNVLCSQSNSRIPILNQMGVHIGELASDPNNPKNRIFTFCTKATFEGVDFYSDNAYTYIFSDGVLDWNKQDLIIDVPQILGRQRLSSNPFRTDATLFYRTKLTDQSVQQRQNEIIAKEAATNQWIDNFNGAPDVIREMLVKELRKRDPKQRFNDDYVDVVDDAINGGYIVKPNYLVRNIEVRDWQLSEYVYSHPLYLIKALSSTGINFSSSYVTNTSNTPLQQFKASFFGANNSDKLQLYCSFVQNHPELYESILADPHIDMFYHEAYTILDEQRIKALRYREKDIQDELNFIKAHDQIVVACQIQFERGSKYLLSDVKTALQNIYNQLGLTHTSLASELPNYISAVQRQLTSSGTGKRELYYEIL